eukprot:TRINITY_DN4242_c0_g1_i1.p1 TRINITY_DN4242_c0_g1~~TRINITY_DN4242_c0_g1_i1.p1  ORF type:complete len:123 (+),score=8.47 TRINITY_DN4242_c0_g1_i1:59-427(+)
MRPGLVLLLKFSFFIFFPGGTELILGPLIDFLLFILLLLLGNLTVPFTYMSRTSTCIFFIGNRHLPVFYVSQMDPEFFFFSFFFGEFVECYVVVVGMGKHYSIASGEKPLHQCCWKTTDSFY